MKIPKGFIRIKTGQPVKPGDWQLIDKSCDFEPTAYDQDRWCYEVVVVRRW